MRKLLPCLLVLAASTACDREKRFGDVSKSSAEIVSASREVELQPGGRLPDENIPNPYEGNYDAMNEGKRLFSWYNCAGCHSPGGGGGIGPPLIDDYWIYGNKPANIFETIVRGRPHGMPAFGGKLPKYQVWQLVTYVRSMSSANTKEEKPK